MKKLTLAIGTASFLLAASASAANESDLKLEAAQAIKALASELGKTVKAAKMNGGAEHAVEVCNSQALPLTTQIAESRGLHIGRTSLKVRNSDNNPDSWEQGVLAQFAQRKAAGEPVRNLIYSEVVETDGHKEFRLMKAIGVKEECLGCHGESINPELAGKLDLLYPDDNARGFKKGDLRGAFTVRKTL